MRAPSEDLFRLVKAMNKGEKRNFKLMAGMLTGDKKYIDLFQQIDKQTIYDESKILKTGIRQGQLSVAKNYLFKFLLKSLVYLRSNSFSELMQLSEQVRILMSKHLYHEAGKLLKKALQQSKDLEAFHIQLDLLDLRRKLLMTTLDGKDTLIRLKEIQVEKSAVLAEISYLNELNHLHDQVKLLQTRKLNKRGEEDAANITEILDHKLIRRGEPEGAIRTRLVYLKIVRKLFSYQGKPKEAALQCQRILETYRTSELLLESELGDYFLELSNLCTYLFRSGRSEESLKLMGDFLKAKDKYKNADIEFFQRFYILQMAYAIHVGDPEYGLSFLDDLNNDLKTIHKKIPSIHLKWLYYLVAYLFIMDNQPDQSLNWINKFFSIPSIDFLKDLPGFARLLKLLVLFDLKEFSLLETETVNTQKLLDRFGNHTSYEYEILRSLRYLIREIGLGQDKKVYQQALSNFRKEMRKNGNMALLEVLNYELWLEHKISGKKMAELIKKDSSTLN